SAPSPNSFPVTALGGRRPPIAARDENADSKVGEKLAPGMRSRSLSPSLPPGAILSPAGPVRFEMRVQCVLWPASTTAPSSDIAAQTFRVIHPFHPWRGQRFELVAYKSAWGEDRVYFHNEEQQLIALPASWTDVVAADPFVSTAEGRALFRTNDLFELAGLVRRLSWRGANNL